MISFDPRTYGALGDGAADDTQAIRDTFTAAAAYYGRALVCFSPGAYKMTGGVTVNADNVHVDFGNAKIIASLSGGGSVFTFGTTGDTPTRRGLVIRGGHFVLETPTSTQNTIYLDIRATKEFIVCGCRMDNVSNGGVYVQAGCENGLIESITVTGKSGYTTCRAIWLDGSSASDYASQLVNTSSITRNATATPQYAVKNVRVVGCTIVLPALGIYLMNARDCIIADNYIDISGSGDRCIALNTYSPRALIFGNKLIGNQASTGILVTQLSTGVVITSNLFRGTFGGNRDVYVQYLANAQILGNRFETDSTQQILVDMGGQAVVRGNTFSRSAYSANQRALKLTTIDEAVAGTGDYGNAATMLPGIVFEDNVVGLRCTPVFVNTPTSQSGNVPGLEAVVVRNNLFYDFNNATGGDEFGLRVYANGSTHVVKYNYCGNAMYPENYAARNNVSVSGSGHVDLGSDIQSAVFTLTNPAGGGAVTSAKAFGANLYCGVSRSANDLIISPRAQGGAAGASVAIPVAVVDLSGNVASYRLSRSGVNYVVKLFDGANNQIPLSTTAATVNVQVVGSAT